MAFQDASLLNRLAEFAEGYKSIHPLSATIKEAISEINGLTLRVSQLQDLLDAEEDDHK